MSNISQKLILANVKISSALFIDFWPEGSLYQVITRDNIEHYGLQDRGLEQYIVQHAPKLFSICLMIRVRKPELKVMMTKFQRRGFNDRSLPLSEQVMNQQLADIEWYDGEKAEFLKIQWKFLAPKFPLRSGPASIPKLLDTEVLPFVKVRGLPQPEQGNYSIVYEVTVAPSHLNPPPRTKEEYNFALKEINITPSQDPRSQATEKASVKEWRAFVYIMGERRRGVLSLKHLVDVRAVFYQQWKRYFMIPWASGGSLRQLLESGRKALTPELVKQTVTQLLGMAQALAYLHRSNCRHGDLKPENILIFDQDHQARLGTWKIADLGLAKFHYNPTAMRGATSNMCGTISYQAPEVIDARRNRRALSRLFDVWSMGCIILQLITWLLYDFQGVEALATRTRNHQRQESTFWSQEQSANGHHGQNRIHHEVERQMERLLISAGGSQAIEDLIRLVKNKLLVISLPKRGNAVVLANELKQICDRGAHDERYWGASRPLFNNSAHPLLTTPDSFKQSQNEVGYSYPYPFGYDPLRQSFRTNIWHLPVSLERVSSIECDVHAPSNVPKR